VKNPTTTAPAGVETNGAGDPAAQPLPAPSPPGPRKRIAPSGYRIALGYTVLEEGEDGEWVQTGTDAIVGERAMTAALDLEADMHETVRQCAALLRRMQRGETA
jgi:hypothetical protein